MTRVGGPAATKPRQASPAKFPEGWIMELGEAIDAVEETYEFMLAYAAQGRRQEDNDTAGGIRASLKKADGALSAIAGTTVSGAEAAAFLEIVRQDAAKASAAIRLVLA